MNFNLNLFESAGGNATAAHHATSGVVFNLPEYNAPSLNDFYFDFSGIYLVNRHVVHVDFVQSLFQVLKL